MAPLQAQNFEAADGYALGAPIETISGWSSNAGSIAEISGKEAATGGQSLRIDKHAEGDFVERAYVSAPDGVTFIDFQIRPSVEVNEPTVAVEVDGAMIGFVGAEKKRGEVVGVIAGGDEELESRATGRQFAMKPKGEATEWLRLTVRRDRVRGTWDLFVEGELVLFDLPARGSADTTVRFYAGANPVYLDDVSVGETNILYPDADKDGMPDMYERTFGLNARSDNRLADQDLDGITDLEEYVRGSRPDVPEGQTAGRVIYVDNLCGDEGNTGEARFASAGAAGPKQSIREAMEAAQEGDIVMVLRGNGRYEEGKANWSGGGFTVRFEDSNTKISFRKTQ